MRRPAKARANWPRGAGRDKLYLMRSESPDLVTPLTPLDAARAKLQAPTRADRPLAAVAAAALFAFAALVFATAAIFAPPLVVTPIAHPGVR